jgi:predicted RNase H-like HicB family nuclease
VIRILRHHGFVRIAASGSHQKRRHPLTGKQVIVAHHRGHASPGAENQAWFETMSKAIAKYEVIIHWSEEDQAYVAEAPELPGCAAHGPTQDRALSNAQDAIRLWIDTAKEFGDAVPA